MKTLLNTIDAKIACRKTKFIEKMTKKKPGMTTVEIVIWVFIVIILAVIVFGVIKGITNGSMKTAATKYNTMETELKGMTVPAVNE